MRKRNLFSAFLMLLITGVALTTSSYAWFSVNSAVQVEGLDINVEVAEGIQVSTDASTWKATLSLSDITTGYSGHTNQIPTVLKPVSTIGSQSAGSFDFFYGEIVTAGTTTLTSTGPETESAGNPSAKYIAFDLFIQAVSSTPIYLQGTSGITYSGTASSVGLEYSSRIGFLNQGTDATSTPATARALASGTSSSQKIWEPYATSHTTWALGNGATAATKHETYGLKATGTGLSVVYADQATDATGAAVNFGKVTTITPDTDASPFSTSNPDNIIFTAGAGITKVRVYVWIEGQDIDNENSVSLGTHASNDINSSLVVTIGLRKLV